MFSHLKYLLKLNKFYFFIILIVIVVLFEFIAFGLAYPIISIFLDLDQSIINNLNTSLSEYTNLKIDLGSDYLLLLLISVLIFQFLFFILYRYFLLRISLSNLYELRSRIYNKFFTNNYMPDISSSQLLNCLTVQSYNVFLFWGLYIDFIKKILLIISLSFLLIIISPKISLVSIIFFLIIFSFLNQLSRLSKKYGKKMIITDEVYLKKINESIKNYRYIKISNLNDKLLLPIQNILKKFNLNQFYFSMLSKFIKESAEPIIILCVILIGYLATSLFDTKISLLLVVILVLRRLSGHLTSSLNIYQSLIKNRESLNYIEKLLNKFEKNNKDFKKIKLNKFYFQNLSLKNLAYKSQKKILFNNLNFSIKRNESVVIYGKSGLGKTTLINLITGLYSPYKGSIFFNEFDISKHDFPNNFKIGIVTQEENLFNMSLLDNLRLKNPKASKNQIMYFLKFFDLHLTFKNHKIDLNVNINEKTSNFSGGEIQRLALIREILNEPDLLILDEPTSALDSVTLAKVLKYLKSINGKVTIIVFTHQHEYKKLKFKNYQLSRKHIKPIP